MKKSLIFLSALSLLTSCYDDYVRDYDDGSAVYTAYQYDLRTFVIGENQSFDFTVALGGVINNNKDRKVSVVLDQELLTKDLSTVVPLGGYESFTAMDAFLGKGKFGYVCQPYVTADVLASGITALTPLPESYYTVSGLDGMTIKSGRHTATATIKATDFITEDSKAFAPYYALGFQILSADANQVVPECSFEVIAVRCENKLYGQWGHGGASEVLDASGSVVGRTEYDMSIIDDRVYTLTTVDARTVKTNKMGKYAGALTLVLNDDNTVTVTSTDGKYDIKPIEGEPSTYNNPRLLQDRTINLNYQYQSGSNTYVIRDVLKFRSRSRDGVIEYEDENPEHYK